jgi:hypothetical protein
MNLSINTFILISTTILSLNILLAESGGCLGYTCNTYLNSNYDISSSGVYLILSQTVQIQNSDPSSCCLLCFKTNGCNLYQLNFTTSKCRLYSIPGVLANNNDYLSYIQDSDQSSCIGISYKFTGYPTTTTIYPINLSLLAAVQDRNLTAVQEALANGAELNIQDNNGRTSLIIGKNFII